MIEKTLLSVPFIGCFYKKMGQAISCINKRVHQLFLNTAHFCQGTYKSLFGRAKPITPTSSNNEASYSLEDTIAKIHNLSSNNHVRLSLLIGRSPDQPLPVEKGVTWVGFDEIPCQKLEEGRLQIVGDANDEELLSKLRNAFHKVVIDFSTLKFLPDAWQKFPQLLQGNEGELISEADSMIVLRDTPPTDVEAIEYSLKGKNILYKSAGREDEDSKNRRIQLGAQNAAKVMRFFFNEVEVHEREHFPYREGIEPSVKGTYLVMKGPKIDQFDRLNFIPLRLKNLMGKQKFELPKF